MQGKPPDKLLFTQNTLYLPTSMFIVFGRKLYATIPDILYPVIADCYFVGVSPKVFDYLLRPIKRLFGVYTHFLANSFWSSPAGTAVCLRNASTKRALNTLLMRVKPYL